MRSCSLFSFGACSVVGHWGTGPRLRADRGWMKEGAVDSLLKAGVLATLLGALLAPGDALGQLAQEVAEAGVIDWGTWTIKATGTGTPPPPSVPEAERQDAALKSARGDALERLFETIKALNISSETTVGKCLMERAELAVEVKRVLKGFREIGEPRHLSDLSVEIDVEAPIAGELCDLLLPDTGEERAVPAEPGYVCPLCGQPWPADKPRPPGADEAAERSAPQVATVHTGLIVDARGLGVQPALAPRVLNEDGEPVYGVGFVDREYALCQGVLRYGTDMGEAKSDKRVGSSPLIVTGIRACGKRRADLVISNGDASLIHGMPGSLGLLRKCSVLVVF